MARRSSNCVKITILFKTKLYSESQSIDKIKHLHLLIQLPSTNLVVIISSVSKVKLVAQVESGIGFSVILTWQNTILKRNK